MTFLKTLGTICSLILIILMTPAHAAGHGGAPMVNGIQLPLTNHGQVQILLAKQSEILRLSQQQLATPESEQVLAFVTQQQRACGAAQWLPALATPNASPYHTCGHALASGLQYLLHGLLKLPTPDAEVLALEKQFHRPEAFAACDESLTRFTTASVVTPRWGALPLLPAGIVVLSLAGFALAWRKRRPRALARFSLSRA